MLLAMPLALTAPAHARQAPPVPTLLDMDGHWAAGEVRAATMAGWVNGYPGGTFRPGSPVTRAEFVKMLTGFLDRTHLLKPAEDVRIQLFNDRLTDGTHWSVQQGFIKNALAYRVLEPTDYPMLFKGELVGWSFAPDQPLTRLEAAVMLTRAAGGKYEAERYQFHAGEVPAPTVTFADGPQLPDWAKGWVAQAAASGMIKGYPDGSFEPERLITRAEAVSMVGRLQSAQRPKTNLLDEVRTFSADQPRLEALPRLAEANRNLVAELDLHLFTEAEQPLWAVEHAWYQVNRSAREAALQNHAAAFYRQVAAMDLTGLNLTGVTVTFRTDLTWPIATMTYDGTHFTYTEREPLQPAVAYPELAAKLLAGLTVMADRSSEQISRAKENLAQIEHDLANVTARTVQTFPYTYLPDWFQLSEHQVVGWAREQAAAYFEQVRPSVEAVGGRLAKVEFVVAPDDTAKQLSPYRSLAFGDSLRANPVLVATYDGSSITVVKRPFPLSEYLDALTPVYAQEQCGEGCSQPVIDPAVPEAQQVLRNLILTYGQTGR